MSSILTLTGGNTHPDGLLLGSEASEKVGFHGKTPVVQSSGAAQAAVAPTSTNGTAGAVSVAPTSTNGTAGAASADLAALAAEAEKIGDDVRSTATGLNTLAAETEKIGDDARAAITLVNALRQALVDHGLIAGA